VYERLWAMGHKVEMLDGRHGRRNCARTWASANRTATRTPAHRIRGRPADAQWRVVLGFGISPYRAIRDRWRAMIGDFAEIYRERTAGGVRAEGRPRGCYPQGAQRQLPGFTGSTIRKRAAHPESSAAPDRESLAESVDKILRYLRTAAGVTVLSLDGAQLYSQ